MCVHGEKFEDGGADESARGLITQIGNSVSLSIKNTIKWGTKQKKQYYSLKINEHSLHTLVQKKIAHVAPVNARS
jgi:hypothetical protein